MDPKKKVDLDKPADGASAAPLDRAAYHRKRQARLRRHRRRSRPTAGRRSRR